MANEKILVVDDDVNICELLRLYLEKEGYTVSIVNDGESAVKSFGEIQPDLMLLDIMLPGEDGVSILKKLRANPKTRNLPVILLTAKDSEYDKVIGLDSGADDYVAKPFGIMELISRIKAVLRRCGHEGTVSDDCVYNIGCITLNTKKHSVEVDGNSVELTLKEFEVLRLLMKNQGTVITRDILLEQIWGYDFDGETRTVDVHIRTLRQKLGHGGNIIKTIRGVGYRAEE